MANVKTTMTDIRVIIREFSRGTSLREMERKLMLSRTSLRAYRERAEASGKCMIDLLKLNDAELQAIMLKGDGHRGRDAERYAFMQENVEDYAKDMRRKYMTYDVLYEEYQKSTVYNPYNKAKRDLFEAIGPYCSYCERKIELGGAIEHVQPKSRVEEKECIWDNFLLGCINCNSTKGDTDINDANINDYAWPDIDDTYHLIKYDPITCIPSPADELSDNDRNRISKLIKLVGLDKPSPKVGTVKYKEASDLRVEKRKEVTSYAKEYRSDFLSIADEAKPNFIKTLKLLVKEMGLWCIWMHEMEDIPELRAVLIDLLPGTRKEFFE